MTPLSSPTPDMLHRFGIAALRSGQQDAIEALAQRRDVLVILPTGGGKSLCYQLPAACGAAPAVVVSPLVALMKDQVDALRRRGIAAAQLSGAVSAAERACAWAMLEAGTLTLVYLAPEALASRNTRDRLARAAPRLLAIDEAHCISEWGESFRPSYLGLGAVREALAFPPTIALTATATPRTARDIVARLALRDPVTVAGGFDRANLRLHVRSVANDAERRDRLLALGRSAPGPTVFYASSRRDTERFAGSLTRVGVPAVAFHAGLPTDERARMQDRFQENRVRVIVATNAFGMGVDKPDVRLVVHAAPPLTLEAYYQEAGRGGRDGLPADCVVLLAPDDLARARARIASERVTVDLLQRLIAILASPSVPHAVGLRESDGIRRTAARLAVSARDVSAALRLLSEAGALAPSSGRGTLRFLASEARLANDRTVPPDDAQAVQRLMRLAGGERGRTPPLTMRALSRLAPGADARRFLQRLESQQLAVWQPIDAPWTLRQQLSTAALAELATRHATRQARALFRHRQVARLTTSARCRRLVLLRYFGDDGPVGSCGACDVCGVTP